MGSSGISIWRVMIVLTVGLMMYANFAESESLTAKTIDEELEDNSDDGDGESEGVGEDELTEEEEEPDELEDFPDDDDDDDNDDDDDDVDDDEVDDDVADFEGLRRKRTGAVDYWLWPNGRVPYVGLDRFGRNERQLIEKAFEIWSQNTCVKFVEKTDKDRDYIDFKKGRRCLSQTGRIPGKGAQPFTLTHGCMRSLKIILHELGHSLGFYHTQNRPDRDNYIKVNFRNVQRGRKNNLAKYSTGFINTRGVKYDYRSIMHYGQHAFSRNRKPTIITKNKKFQRVIGSVSTISFRDVKLINLMYKCAKRNKCQPRNCPGEGYQGSDCQCYCPKDPLTVTRCDSISCTNMKGDKNCAANKDYCWHSLVKSYCQKTCEECYKVKQ